MHLPLAFAAAALVGVIIMQDYLYKPLRLETVSAGLTGPYHWVLDASYVLLAVALWLSFGYQTIAGFVAIVAGASLLLTAVTNTFAGAVDKITGGQHVQWHSRFTALVFASALMLQVLENHHSALWGLTVTNVAAPIVLHVLHDRADYIEKVAVLVMCIWLIAWALL